MRTRNYAHVFVHESLAKHTAVETHEQALVSTSNPDVRFSSVLYILSVIYYLFDSR